MKLPVIFSSVLIAAIFLLQNTNNYKVIFPDNNLVWQKRFNQVLDTIKKYSIRKIDWSDLDWKKYEQKQLSRLPINKIEEFNNAVSDALKDLKDHHSFLIPKNNNKKEDVQKESNCQDNNLKYEIYAQDGIGIIKMYSVGVEKFDGESEYVEPWVIDFQKHLKKIENCVTRGWIIDLTENCGGTYFPMVAGLSRFVQKTDIGGFYASDKSTIIVKFDGQSFFTRSSGTNYVIHKYKSKFEINRNKLPVIVLIGHYTASSGEFLALILKRQKNVKLIGQETAGCASGNQLIDLPDKLGYLNLTTGLYLNTQNKPLIEQKIIPDIILDKNIEFMYKKAKDLITNSLN